MSAESNFIAAVERVTGRPAKRTGPNTFVAPCPAHDDNRPSLSIRVAGDHVLIHCWAGCGAAEIVAALGLELRDLFEHRRTDTYIDARCPQLPPARELITLFEHDLSVIDIAGSMLQAGQRLTATDMDAFSNALADIRKILDVCHERK